MLISDIASLLSVNSTLNVYSLSGTPKVLGLSGSNPNFISSPSFILSSSLSGINGFVPYLLTSSPSVRLSPSESGITGFVPIESSCLLVKPSLSESASASDTPFFTES